MVSEDPVGIVSKVVHEHVVFPESVYFAVADCLVEILLWTDFMNG